MKQSDKNTGISLLRIFMCFEVVLDHFWQGGGQTLLDKFFSLCGVLAVPCFMFLSFYLTAGLFKERNETALKKRMGRLLFPLVFWTLAYYIILSVCNESFLDWKHIFYSILFGSSNILAPQLWFISTQILMVCLLFILSSLAENSKNIQIAYIVIIIMSFVFQYTGMNYYLFGSAVYESKWTLGRFVEVLPVAATGFLYAVNEQKIRYKGIIFLCLAGLVFATKGLAHSEGFLYSGLDIYFRALLICFLFINLPQIKCRWLAGIINYIAQYTMGVYCLHFLVGRYMWQVLELFHIGINTTGLLYNILVYAGSFLISIAIGFAAQIKKLKTLECFVK